MKGVAVGPHELKVSTFEAEFCKESFELALGPQSGNQKLWRFKNYHDLEEFIADSKKFDLKYLVIDKDDKLFDDLRKNPAGYPYLNKIFDSNDFDFENHFMIYEIDYRLFDNNDK